MSKVKFEGHRMINDTGHPLLPDKMSDLIRVALADLRKVEAMPNKYIVNMNAWHHGATGKHRCNVCLAGAVLAQTCKVPRSQLCNGIAGPEDRKIDALNELRSGWVSDAAQSLGIDREGFRDREIIDYNENPEEFHAQMEQLAKDLAEAGL